MSVPEAAARATEDSTAFRMIARIGYVVLGVVHIVIGVIAISLVTGGGGEADQSGAMKQIQQTPVGVLLLWVIVAGLSALAVWQIADASLERDPDAKKRWGHRVKFVGTAVAYIAIAWTALVYALGGQSDTSGSSQSFSAKLLAAPGGVVLLVVVGLIVGAIGIAFIVRGVTRGFERNLALPAGVAAKGIITFGAVGYVAKGVAIAVTGVLFVVAALTHHPEEAGGLDAALHSLAALPFGVVILWVVGAGLVIYGLFCFARARYARM